MAYGLLLYKEIQSPLGDQRVEIYKDGYSGSAVEIAGLHKDGITISKDCGDVSQAITTSVLTIALSDCNEIDYTQFFTPNATLFKVVWKTKVSSSWVTRWTGFITPDSFSENLSYRDTLTLTARDNLGRLNDYDFSLTRGQMLSIRSIINSGLSVAGVAMGVTFTTAKVATSPSTILAVDGLVNTSLLQGMTWHAALTLLLEGIGCTLSWNEGNAFEVRDITQAPSATQAAFFINKSGYRQIRPAWKNLTAEQDYGLRDNFYEGQFSSEDCGSGVTFTPTSGTHGWDVSTPFLLMNPYKGAPTPSETLYIPIQGGDAIDTHIDYTFKVPVLKRPLKISLKCNNTAWIWQDPADAFGYTGISSRSILSYTQQGQYYRSGRYFLRFRFNIFITVDGTEYVLRDTWQEYDASTIQEPYLYFVMPAVVDEYGRIVSEDTDNEVSFYVGEVPGAGTMRFVIYKTVAQSKEDGEPEDRAMALLTANSYTLPFAKITDVCMYIDEGVNGRSKLVTVNTGHNVQDSLSVGLGQVPNDRGNVLLYLGGLFYTDTYNTPLTSFKRSSSAASTYDLLELVAREHISFNNDNYNQLSGTMMAASAFSFDKGISFGGVAYRLVSASLNILSNTLQVQAMQTEPSFATADYTIEEVDSEGGYSSRGSYSGGGVPQGATGGGGYFYKVDDTDIATPFDINIIQSQGSGYGSGSGDGDTVYKNISEILRHLSLQVLNAGTANEETIIVADITFASQKGIVAGGIAGGGGGTSGGSLETLADVSLSNKANGDILRYNALTSHWENGPLSLALADLSNVSSTAPTDGQALVWDNANSVWKPGTVSGGSVTVVNKAATIGTSLTTIATVGGTDITAKITHQTVTLASGTNDGTLKLTTAAGTTDNIAVKGITATKISHWDSAYSNMGYADKDTNGNNLATQTWVTNKGYLTSIPAAKADAIGGIKIGYSESNSGSASNRNYAVKLSSNKAYVNVPWEAYSLPLAASGTRGGIQIGYSESNSGSSSNRNYAVKLSSEKAYVNVPWVEYSHPTGGANTTITAANGKVLSAITVNNLGHVTSVSSKTLAAEDIPDLSGSYLPISGGTLTGDLRLKDGNYGQTLYFGNGSYCYLSEDTDDHLKIYARYGIDILTSSTSYAVNVGSSSAATPMTVFGNLTVGSDASTSACKTLTLYGRTTSSYPALSIYGVVNADTNYRTDIYRDSTALKITSSVAVTGNITATGAITAGSASDRRLKKDIKSININTAAEVLAHLNPVSFAWNDTAKELGELSGPSCGFLADEYLTVIPSAGRKIWGDYDAIDYNQSIPYLVAGWQHQNMRIRILEGEISALKQEICQMRRKANVV